MLLEVVIERTWNFQLRTLPIDENMGEIYMSDKKATKKRVPRRILIPVVDSESRPNEERSPLDLKTNGKRNEKSRDEVPKGVSPSLIDALREIENSVVGDGLPIGPSPKLDESESIKPRTTDIPEPSTIGDDRKPAAKQITSELKGVMNPGKFQQIQISTNPPSGRGIHIHQIGNSGLEGQHAFGDVSDYVQHYNFGIHGALLQLGTSATHADARPSKDDTGKVRGTIPRAVKALRELALSAAHINPKNVDGDGRPFQFAVVSVLGREDHKRVIRQLESNNPILMDIIGAAGAPAGTKIRTLLTNDIGDTFCLSVEFPDPAFRVGGQAPRHFIFLHSTRAEGGGKSDVKLTDGTLGFEMSCLSQEYNWWINGLERVNGRIGSIESTLGGTSRVSKYAMLRAMVPRHLFAKESFESINIDTCRYVKDHYATSEHEYRQNFASTLLRTIYGRFGYAYRGIRVELSDRGDLGARDMRDLRAGLAILRQHFLGAPQLEVIRGDISDEFWGRMVQEHITNSKYTTIVDPTTKDEFPEHRTISLGTGTRISLGMIRQWGMGQSTDQAIDVAERILEQIRGYISSVPSTVTAGGFLTLIGYCEADQLDTISKSQYNQAMETFSNSFKSLGVQKVMLQLVPIPKGLGPGSDSIIVHIFEDMGSSNVLAISMEDVKTHERRLIIQNPHVNENTKTTNWDSGVLALGRLFRLSIDSHEASQQHDCIADAEVIEAYHRHWYSGNYGSCPKFWLGGSNDRKRPNDVKGGSK